MGAGLLSVVVLGCMDCSINMGISLKSELNWIIFFHISVVTILKGLDDYTQQYCLKYHLF